MENAASDPPQALIRAMFAEPVVARVETVRAVETGRAGWPRVVSHPRLPGKKVSVVT